jgi:hypothetical protein
MFLVFLCVGWNDGREDWKQHAKCEGYRLLQDVFNQVSSQFILCVVVRYSFDACLLRFRKKKSKIKVAGREDGRSDNKLHFDCVIVPRTTNVDCLLDDFS